MKQSRNSRSGCIAEGRVNQETANDKSTDSLEYWIRTKEWHKQNFNQPFRSMHGTPHLHHLFARQRSSSPLRRKNSQSTLQTPSDQLPREVKSAQYRDPEYEDKLEKKGSYMRKSELDITDSSKSLCRNLLQLKQTVPQDSLFHDDLFEKTCQKIRTRNEAMVIRDISLLIVPSAQTLATYGAIHLNHLYESVNEGWNSTIPLHGTRPQPDYSVGFGRSAFTEEQLEKLEPFVGEIGSKVQTYFMATTRMYFPFLTCEVKCGAAALDVADRQNAHSMTVAVRGIVELYRAVKREKELDREILTFSFSHDHRSVRIYGHYPVIEGDRTTFYRHPIHEFSFTALDGKEKWTAYKFAKNVYNHHSLKLQVLIRSGIDDLPAGVNFDLSQSVSFQSESQSSQQLNVESILGEDDSHLGSQEVTPTTSLTQPIERASKKPKNQRAAGESRRNVGRPST